jgi:hypothetical protein
VRPSRARAAALAAAALLVGAAAGSAAAAPAAAGVPDAPGDSRSAPDLLGLAVQSDGAGISVTTALSKTDLSRGEVLLWALDADGRADTGSPQLGGADRVVGVLGQDGRADQPLAMRWDPGSARWTTSGVTPPPIALTAPGTLGWTSDLAALGSAPGVSVGVRAVSADLARGGSDSAPESSQPLLRLAIPVPAPPAPPPPPAPAPLPASAPAPAAAPAPPPGVMRAARNVVRRPATTRRLLSPLRVARPAHRTLRLRWRRDPRARYYNVQLFRGKRKVLSFFPTRPRQDIGPGRLAPGRYTVLIWSGLGTKRPPRYASRPWVVRRLTLRPRG